MTDLAKACEDAAHLGGEVLQDWATRFHVREKGPSDLVTEADLAAQDAVRAFLAERFPDHRFLGEEDAPSHSSIAKSLQTEGTLWIVDPLDGTTNYAHHVPHYCVSVAATRQGSVLAAAILNPANGECYTAVASGGAYLNGNPIRTSNIESLEDSLVAASFPPRIQRGSREIDDLLKAMESSQAVRRSGSAALNMCYVAAGRFDAYWATETKAWDVAAGWLIVQEAGGFVTALDGSTFDLSAPYPLATATADLSQQMVELLDRQTA